MALFSTLTGHNLPLMAFPSSVSRNLAIYLALCYLAWCRAKKYLVHISRMKYNKASSTGFKGSSPFQGINKNVLLLCKKIVIGLILQKQEFSLHYQISTVFEDNAQTFHCNGKSKHSIIFLKIFLWVCVERGIGSDTCLCSGFIELIFRGPYLVSEIEPESTIRKASTLSPYLSGP